MASGVNLHPYTKAVSRLEDFDDEVGRCKLDPSLNAPPGFIKIFNPLKDEI